MYVRVYITYNVTRNMHMHACVVNTHIPSMQKTSCSIIIRIIRNRESITIANAKFLYIS